MGENIVIFVALLLFVSFFRELCAHAVHIVDNLRNVSARNATFLPIFHPQKFPAIW